MAVSLYGGFGVDKSSNKLTKSDTKLEDCLNVMLDDSRNWVKRLGQQNKFASAAIDAIYLNSEERYFVTKASEYSVFNTNGTEFVPFNFSGLHNNTDISSAEYVETLIFTHPDNPKATLKYDGSSVYRAGLPVPTITGLTLATPPALDTWHAVFYDFMDAYGNTVFGPLAKFKSLYGSSFTVSTLNGTGFYGGYLKRNFGVGNQTLNSGSPTITNIISKSSDIIVGSRFIFRAGSSFFSGTPDIEINPGTDSLLSFVSVRITTITETSPGVWSITFNSSDFGTNSVLVRDNGISATDISRISIRCFVGVGASSSLFQEGLFTGASAYALLLDNSAATKVVTQVLIAPDPQPLSAIYDIENSKLRPPLCKYISVFGDQLVFASVGGLWNFNNDFIKYNNDDIVMYSDISEGDTGENISEINRQLIGNTYDGFLTGLARIKDSIIVFKDKSIYAIDGILLPGEYNLRKIETSLIGCISHKSILVTQDNVLFHGNDSIYATNGYQVKEFGDDISSDIDSSTPMRSVVSIPVNGYIFYNGAKTFYYNYNFAEWFIWDNIDASNGLVLDNDGNAIFFTGAQCVEFKSTRDDFGTPFTAFIQTNFIHLKKPHLLKKATGLRVFNFGSCGNLTVDLLKEWDQTIKSTATIDYSATPKSAHKGMSPILGQSISFKISNATATTMTISGLELEIELNETKDKNVK